MNISISDDLVMSAEELHASSFGGPVGFIMTWLDMFEDKTPHAMNRTKNETKRSPKANLCKKKLRGVVLIDRSDPVVTAEGEKLLKELFNPCDPENLQYEA